MRGDGGVYRPKDRPTWYCYVPAKPKRAVRGPFRTEAEARRAWKDLRREISAGTYRGPEAERITVADLLDAYRVDLLTRGKKSMVSFAAHAKAVNDALGTVRACEVTSELVNRIRQGWLGAGTAPATTDRYLETLRAAYRLAARQRRISADHVPFISMMRPNNRRTGFVENDVFSKLYAALPPVEADATLFAYRSGWRRSEVEGLTWDQVDEEAREARLYDSKNGTGRVLPLEGELLDVIRRRKGERRLGTAAVFHNGGEAFRDWRGAWYAACKAAGAPELLFHDLRRSAARNMIRAGIPESVVMAITGHRTRAMFDRYNIASEDQKREAIRKISYGTATV